MNLRHLNVLTVLVLCSVPASASAAGWVAPAATVSALGTAFFVPPIVASNGRGDTAVAWVDPATGDVFVSERPVGGSFSVGAAVVSTGDQFVGGLGIDAAGNVYVFFTTRNMTPAASTARVGVKPIGSGTWTVTTVGTANSADPPQAPVTGTVTPDGKALAVWFQAHSNNATQSKMVFSVKPAGSALWGAKADLPGTTANAASGPRVAMNDAGQAALILQSQFCPGFDQGIRAATMTAANVWTTANNVHVCAAGGGVAGADIGISSTGMATATWTRTDGAHTIAQFSTKAIGDASFPAAPASPGANDLSAAGADATSTTIAVAPSGETTIAWARGGIIQERTRAAIGGAFAAATTIPGTLTAPTGLMMRAAPGGTVGLVWAGTNATPKSVIGGAARPAGGAFAGVPATAAVDDAMPAVAADGEGNFPTAWVHMSSGPQFAVQATVIDGAGPDISGVIFPATATAGVAFPYGATLTDRWSTSGGGTWAFGDGTTGPLTGTKSYAGGGTFTATLTATDGFGNQSTSASMVTVTADTTPPTVTQRPVPASATETALASGLPLDFDVSEGATVTSTATIPYKFAVRLHLTKKRKNHPETIVIGSGSSTIAAAGTVTVTIEFTAAAKKKLKRRKIEVTITSVVEDAAGNAQTVTSSVTLTPAKKRR
jgi:hypothetical protein